MQVKKFPDHVDTFPPFDARHVQKKKVIHALHACQLVHNLELTVITCSCRHLNNAALTKLSFKLFLPNRTNTHRYRRLTFLAGK